MMTVKPVGLVHLFRDGVCEGGSGCVSDDASPFVGPVGRVPDACEGQLRDSHWSERGALVGAGGRIRDGSGALRRMWKSMVDPRDPQRTLLKRSGGVPLHLGPGGVFPPGSREGSWQRPGCPGWGLLTVRCTPLSE